MAKIKLNGREVETAPGEMLLGTCIDEGAYVPHYCFHRGLRPDGNCRMCLVKLSTSRKLEVACMTRPSDGMEVTTESPEIDAARKAVLEYMLANHPLDCPICDKAGECDLQDFTFRYRDGVSRFREDKAIKGTVDLGPNVKIWGNRCIACTRCVRFCEDVTGTGELGIINRGDHSVAGVHPGVALDNPMSLNVVDICPVGALIDKNFLYQARVWFAKKTDTVCASCSKGCNLTATSLAGHLKRLRPRLNPDVNQWWICDHGRLNWRWTESEERLKLPRGDTAQLAAKLLKVFDTHGPGSIGILASTAHTYEELYLLRQLADAFGAVVGFFGRKGDTWTAKNGWKIEADKTPNAAGVAKIFGEVLEPDLVFAGVKSGAIKALIALNAIPEHRWSEAMIEATAGAEVLVVGDLFRGPLADRAHFVWPLASWLEKDGIFVNKDGRYQRIRSVVGAPGGARPEWQWLQDLLLETGVRTEVDPVVALFTEATGLTWEQVGLMGVVPPVAPAGTIEGGLQPGAK
jgi:NADH-quinone oxidoreductase subunit G